MVKRDGIHFNNIICISVEIMYNPILGAVRQFLMLCYDAVYT